MRIRDLQILTGVMVVLSTIFFGMAWHVWTQPQPDANTRDIAKWQPTENFTQTGPAKPEAQYALSEALARPLFRESRRPFEPFQAAAVVAVPEPVPQPATPQPDASQLSVKGILIKGELRQALIVTPAAPDGVWMTTGAEVMGWKITGLGPNGVTLVSGQQGVDLKLYVDNEPN